MLLELVADKYSRKQVEALEAVAKTYKAKGLAWMKVNAEGVFEGGISKFYAGKEVEICTKLDAGKNDLLLFVSDENWQLACTALGAVRKQRRKNNWRHAAEPMDDGFIIK